MTLPFAGHPVGARDEQEAKNDEDKIESAYRFLLADLMPFGKNARIRLEHGGTDESDEHYETVTYWYGLPGASLVQTDDAQGRRPGERSSPRTIVSPDGVRALYAHIALRVGRGHPERQRDLSRQRPTRAAPRPGRRSSP